MTHAMLPPPAPIVWMSSIGTAILRHLDVLVAGRYVQARHVGRGLLGSSNQHIHLLTPRYTPADFRDLPMHEVIVHRDGAVTFTGISSWRRRPRSP